MFKKVVNDKKNPNVYHEVEYEHIETKKKQKIPKKRSKIQFTQKSEEESIESESEESPRLQEKRKTVRRANKDELAKYDGVYAFVGAIAGFMSISAKLLLNDPTKTWEEQSVMYKLYQCNKNGTEVDSRFRCFLRAVLSQDVYGVIISVYNGLKLSTHNVTLQDVIESPVTQERFAELIALCSRKGADRSAQSGRLYMPQGNGKLAFNVHSGLQRSKLNARVIAHLRIWFSGIQKDSKGALYYSEPSFITQWKKENDTFY